MEAGIDLSSLCPLPDSFFARDTPTVARELLGTVIVSRVEDTITAGVIVETEAYLGSDDPGSHAATRGITARNRVMYGPPARLYVYFTYGAHHMVNIVTESPGIAGAVLLRAVEPVAGLETMSDRRSGREGPEVANGPGKLTRALGIGLSCNDTPLGDVVTVLVGPGEQRVGPIAVSGRIGLRSGRDLPLRFYLPGNPFVSRGRPDQGFGVEVGSGSGSGSTGGGGGGGGFGVTGLLGSGP